MSSDDRTLPILTHVLAFLFGWLAPLIILLASENEMVKRHARRAFNWQMSLMIYAVLLLIVLFVSIPLILVVVGIFTLTLSIIALVALSICDMAFSIIAAVRASNGTIYEYPITIRFLRDSEPFDATRRGARASGSTPKPTDPPQGPASSNTSDPSMGRSRAKTNTTKRRSAKKPSEKKSLEKNR
jgi:uncharacterized protein